MKTTMTSNALTTLAHPHKRGRESFLGSSVNLAYPEERLHLASSNLPCQTFKAFLVNAVFIRTQRLKIS